MNLMADSNSVPQSLRVAFDIGGTFTDVVIAGPNRQLFRYKILTLADSVGADVRTCVAQAVNDSGGAPVRALVHGTTIAANAVLERKGAKTGLLQRLLGTQRATYPAPLAFRGRGADDR